MVEATELSTATLVVVSVVLAVVIGVALRKFSTSDEAKLANAKGAVVVARRVKKLRKAGATEMKISNFEQLEFEDERPVDDWIATLRRPTVTLRSPPVREKSSLNAI